MTALFFAVEHFLHPLHVPAVPLERLMPAWVPAPQVLDYAMGAVLLVTGTLLLVNRWARAAAAWLGFVVTVVVVVIYLPMLGPSHGAAELVDTINYIADTLLLAGTALILAEALSIKPAAATSA